MSDQDTITLGAAAILDCNQGPHWAILADWLYSVAARAEAGHVDVDHDYATAFVRALLIEEDA
jgi:hypothetical protein